MAPAPPSFRPASEIPATTDRSGGAASHSGTRRRRTPSPRMPLPVTTRTARPPAEWAFRMKWIRASRALAWSRPCRSSRPLIGSARRPIRRSLPGSIGCGATDRPPEPGRRTGDGLALVRGCGPIGAGSPTDGGARPCRGLTVAVTSAQRSGSRRRPRRLTSRAQRSAPADRAEANGEPALPRSPRRRLARDTGRLSTHP
jgi:hypothetical protein